MKLVFTFFVRLFIAFLAAKVLLHALGTDRPSHLVALTLALLVNTYLFDYLECREEGAWRRSLSPEETGWLVAKAKAWWHRLKAGRDA